jgi:PAS domain S-box-containing protein
VGSVTSNDVASAPSALQPNADEFRALAENLPHLAWIATGDGRPFWYNQQWYRYTGTTPDLMLGQGWQSVHDAAVLPLALQRWKAATEAGEPWEMIIPLKGADGVFRPFLTRVQPVRDEQGQITRWFGTNTDITEQQRIAVNLSEEKRHLETLNRTMEQVSAELNLERLVQIVTDAGVSLTGARFGAFFYNITDARGDALTLYTISGVPRETFSKFPNPRATHVFAPTFNGEGPVRSDDILADPRYGRNAPYTGMPEGHLPVRSYLAVPVKSRSGEVMGGLFFGHPEPCKFTARHEELLVGIAGQAAIGIDNARLYDAAQREIAERRHYEERQNLLIRELHHRVRNTLATVQAILGATARSVSTVEDFYRAFSRRVESLAKTHMLLTEDLWQVVKLGELLETELRPYENTGIERIRLEGPDVELPSEIAVPLGMAFHELTTNAAQFGALSVRGGRLDVTWHVTSEQNTMLHLEWTESGGPPVKAPEQEGFGARVLHRVLAAQTDAKVSVDFQPNGLQVVIDLPLRTRTEMVGHSFRDRS